MAHKFIGKRRVLATKRIENPHKIWVKLASDPYLEDGKRKTAKWELIPVDEYRQKLYFVSRSDDVTRK